MPEKNTLIIFGNGADLYSGLDTRFSDYINPKRMRILQKLKTYEKFRDLIQTYLEKYNIRFSDDIKGKIVNYPLMVMISGDSHTGSFYNSLEKEIQSVRWNYNDATKIATEIKSNLDSLNEELLSSFEYDDNNNFNFWEALAVVTNTNEGSWYDIEKLIKDFIFCRYPSGDSNTSIFKQIENFMNELNNNNYLMSTNYFSPYPRKLKSCSYFCFVIYILIHKNKNAIDNFQSYHLLNELYEFENNFADYIIDNIKTNKSYESNIESLINTLMKISKNRSSNLFTFNYTRPQLSSCNIKKSKNIHGNINNSSQRNNSPVIIGIDNKIDEKYKNNEKDYQNIFSFTKTKRILSLVDENIDVLDSNIDEIIFFGHSLGESDYSYFQSIFDYYDIYDSYLKIKFVFSPRYSKDDDENEKLLKDMNKLESQSIKVSKLINEYGLTLDNTDHGKNLLHKLLTQGRLQIINIEDFLN
ncbi:AbiH family protein [Apilactobacillus nanyangensis]|uniref:AbiH family protein n=1 Tax=Apilactobacillus nanyangensis TaxID=2799579 RepID=UPI001942279E|nr:AbiH family protein [Apilactobacillus nanyangensis]